jgi:single-strand DNA-binding protein
MTHFTEADSTRGRKRHRDVPFDYNSLTRHETAPPGCAGRRLGATRWRRRRSNNKRKGVFNMINKVILVGRLGKDPEMRSTPGGQTVAKFTMATDERYTDKNGEKQERTEWHNIVAWAKLAEICGQYLRKGKLVYIEGSIRTDSWEDKETKQKKYRTEIIANTMKMLDRKGDDEGGGGGYSGARKQAPAAAGAPPDIEDDDEVPF